jgi:hypothetical protein
MNGNENNVKKRVLAIATDSQLLIEYVKSQTSVLENKENNKITSDLKRKVNLEIYFVVYHPPVLVLIFYRHGKKF